MGPKADARGPPKIAACRAAIEIQRSLAFISASVPCAEIWENPPVATGEISHRRWKSLVPTGSPSANSVRLLGALTPVVVSRLWFRSLSILKSLSSTASFAVRENVQVAAREAGADWDVAAGVGAATLSGMCIRCSDIPGSGGAEWRRNVRLDGVGG